MSFSHKEFDLILSRLCHDLISPISATMNGAEMLQEYGGGEQDDIATEATGLIANSAKSVSARLIFFRLAYGGAGSTADFRVSDMRDIADGFLSSRNIGFRFDCDESLVDTRPGAGMVKGVLNMVAIAADSLPKGGDVGLTVSPGADGQMIAVEIYAVGKDAKIPASISQSFDAGEIVGEADTKSIVGVLASRITERFGLQIAVEQTEDRVSFTTAIAKDEPMIG